MNKDETSKKLSCKAVVAILYCGPAKDSDILSHLVIVGKA